jgi:uncharacterized membrane protein YqaE (UPF0057 family)
MKNFNRIQVVALFGVLILNACSTSNDVVSNNFITKRKHNKGFHIDFKSKYDSQKGSDLAQEELSMANDKTIISAAKKTEKSEVDYENHLVSSSIDNKFVSDAVESRDYVNVAETSSEIESNSTSVFENGKNNFVASEKSSKKETKIATKQTIKALKKLAKSNQKDDTSHILIIVLCFFLPPVAVYLNQGEWNDKCWINLLLTCLCGLPGVIHALIVCLK